MSGIRSQITSLFSDLDPQLKRVVAEVLAVEQEFIHMDKPRGIMERIDGILDVVARDALDESSSDED